MCLTSKDLDLRSSREAEKFGYLSDDVLAMGNWQHASDELQQYHSKAVHVALVCQFVCHEVFWIQVPLQPITHEYRSVSGSQGSKRIQFEAF